MTKHYKYLFIGGGFANLAAANYLVDAGESDFTILEKGNLNKKRNCPGLPSNTCFFCKKGCDILEGLGGANSLHGNKLCYFPASLDVTKHFAQEDVTLAIVYLRQLLGQDFYPDLIRITENREKQKEYFSDAFLKRDFHILVERISTKLINSNKVTLNTEVINIDILDNVFHIVLKSDERISAKYLILGTGRSGAAFVEKFLLKNSSKFDLPEPDLGIRIETHKNNFSPLYYYQNDPKFKFNIDFVGNSRTFCAHNSGMVVPVQLGKAFYADGAYGDNCGDDNNIALMTRTNNNISIKEIEHWCSEINKIYQNNLLLKTVDLRDNNKSIIEQINKAIPFWPSTDHSILFKDLLNNLLNGQYSILKPNVYLNSTLKIYGPAIDRFWIRPRLYKNLSTDIDNLYLLGDAAGVSRGFFQALFSGAAWAIQITNTINKKSNTYKWHVSV